jgi:hypothetical protein
MSDKELKYECWAALEFQIARNKSLEEARELQEEELIKWETLSKVLGLRLKKKSRQNLKLGDRLDKSRNFSTQLAEELKYQLGITRELKSQLAHASYFVSQIGDE